MFELLCEQFVQMLYEQIDRLNSMQDQTMPMLTYNHSTTFLSPIVLVTLVYDIVKVGDRFST